MSARMHQRLGLLSFGLILLTAAAPAGAQPYCNNCALDIDGDGVAGYSDWAACFNMLPVPPCDVWNLDGVGFIHFSDLNLWLACGHTCVECGSSCLSHFNVYDGVGQDGPVVTLVDQFQTQVVDLGPANLFMEPVNKNDEGIPEPWSGLTCYPIPSGEPAPPTVIATNQFGSQTLDLLDPVELCVPSSGPSEPLGSLDHYKCYEASGSVVPGPVDLLDNFHDLQGASQTVQDLDPALFCNPVDKNGEGINDISAHLTCYSYTPAGLPPSGPVPIVNQFGEDTLNLTTPSKLCVPSTKQLPVPTPALSPAALAALAAALLAATALFSVVRQRVRSIGDRNGVSGRFET